MMRRDMWKDREATSRPEKNEEGKRIPLSRQQLVTRDPQLTVSWNRVCGYQTRLYYMNAYAGIRRLLYYRVSNITIFLSLSLSLSLSLLASQLGIASAHQCATSLITALHRADGCF